MARKATQPILQMNNIGFIFRLAQKFASTMRFQVLLMRQKQFVSVDNDAGY